MKRKAKTLIIAAAFAPSLVFAWPWSQDMMNQPSIKPQEGPPAPFPKRSIPVTGIPSQLYTSRDQTNDLKNPIEASEESLKKGKYLFKIICAACHGLEGKADSPVSNKIGAIDLTSEYVQETLTEGWIWGTISFGGAIMPAYGVPNEQGGSNDLSPEERWHVVNYVKNQLVEDAAGSVASAQ